MEFWLCRDTGFFNRIFNFDIILFYSIKNYLFRKILGDMKMKTNLVVKLLDQENLLPLSDNSEALFDLIAQLKKTSIPG